MLRNLPRKPCSNFATCRHWRLHCFCRAGTEYCIGTDKALANAKGDFIAFIDDDELPVTDWLIKLFQTCQAYHVDGVLGPVLPRFEGSPPAWVKRGGFCDRPSHATGFKIDWNEGRTGNLLIKREILEESIQSSDRNSAVEAKIGISSGK